MDDDGIGELRALQAKAYGRGGGLTDAEARRLREWEEPSRSPAASSQPVPAPVLVAELSDASPARGTDGRGAPVVSASGDADPASSARSLLRRFGTLAGIVVVVSVALGVLLGWLMFADRGAAPVALSVDQQQWQSELAASGVFDAGSIRAVTTERDVVVWFATKDGGSIVCMVLGDGESSVPSCTARQQAVDGGMRSSIVVGAEDEVQYEVGAQLYLTRAGDPAVVSYGYIVSSQSSNMFASPEEAAVAASLADAGFDGRSVAVVGYDGDVPLWVAMDKETQRLCLLYDGSEPDPEKVCQQPWFASGDDETLVLEREGDDGVTTRYEYTSAYAQNYLTVTREVADDSRG
ncbi:hypothetical protein [Microbacterium maritypicum]